MLHSLAAWLFVMIWSSGFVVARGISGLIDPFLFLLVRFTCVTTLFAVAMLLLRSPLPRGHEIWRLMASGAFMQGLYLGPGFWAVSQGLEAGVMSLMGSLQPPITALLAWYLLNEQINRLTVVGLTIGLAGVVMAVAPNLLADIPSTSLELSSNAASFHWVMVAAVLSIVAVTTGTLLQKSSISSVPLLSSVTFQTLGATLTMLPMAAVFAKPIMPVTAITAGYLAWAVFVLSIGGFTLLTWLVRSGSATRASSLLFIVPPLTAILSWKFYGETLSFWQMAGFLVAIAGVTLARRQSQSP
ncbi:MAG: DMT family transporter [Granulosicoccus sp.]